MSDSQITDGAARLHINWDAVRRYGKDQHPPLNVKQALSKLIMENLPIKYIDHNPEGIAPVTHASAKGDA